MSKGILARWKFSKLEIAQCLNRIDLGLISGELNCTLKIDRMYKYACINTLYRYLNQEPFSSRLFVIEIHGHRNESHNMYNSVGNKNKGIFLANDNPKNFDLDSSISIVENDDIQPKSTKLKNQPLRPSVTTQAMPKGGMKVIKTMSYLPQNLSESPFQDIRKGKNLKFKLLDF